MRVSDLISLLPGGNGSVLDIGARDGFISKILANHFSVVTALDLEKPCIEHDRINCVKGDITALAFPDASFDLVFCAEVLEHIPTHMLKNACRELARVSKKYVLIGVPYKQDIRVGRTTCSNCGKFNPPWGHVNAFNEDTLIELFPDHAVVRQSFVGRTDSQTNWLASAMLDVAGNPYGTYVQEEPCIHCGAKLGQPQARALWQRGLTKAAYLVIRMHKLFIPSRSNWIHQLLQRTQNN